MSFYRLFLRDCIHDFGGAGPYIAITSVTGFVCGGTLGFVEGCMHYKKTKYYRSSDKPFALVSSVVLGTTLGATFGTFIGIAAPVSIPILVYCTLKNKD